MNRSHESRWENFSKVIDKTKESCENAGQNIADHFPDVRMMVQIGSGAEKEIDDILLTRYACYLIAQMIKAMEKQQKQYLKQLEPIVREAIASKNQ